VNFLCHDGQRIKWYRNIAENFDRLSRVHERYRRLTDDRQTDGRHVHSKERKKEKKLSIGTTFKFFKVV